MNIAARIESLTKHYGATVLATREFCGAWGAVPNHRILDTILGTGARRSPADLIELRLGPLRLGVHTRLDTAYQGARALYQRGGFRSAASAFGKLNIEFQDAASGLLAKRCDVLAKDPPPDGDGVFQFTQK